MESKKRQGKQLETGRWNERRKGKKGKLGK